MKKFKLLDNTALAADTKFDWDLCVLCQRVTPENLQCPHETKRNDKGAGYASLANSLQQFYDIGQLPSSVHFSELDDGSGVEETLVKNCAKWHKSCRNLFNKTKLDRALKKQSQNASAAANLDEFDAVTSDVGSSQSDWSERFTRSINVGGSISTRSCFICDDAEGMLHNVCTFDVDYRVRRCANVLQDSKLLAILSTGDLIATEACYHARCLVALYRRAAAVEKEHSVGDNNSSAEHSLAFAQLVEYVAETQHDTSTAVVFKLLDLARKYDDRLRQLGVPVDCRTNSTKLKDKLLAQFTNMRAQSYGKEVLLVFDEDIGNALSTACQYDSDMEASFLVRAAQIIRRDILSRTCNFSCELSIDCQEQSVPQSLSALVQMILEGPSIDDQNDVLCVPATLSISQLIVFNSVKHVRKSVQPSRVTKTRHNIEQETPLPLYLSMMVHAETRKRDLIDKLFHLGLSVSYDRLLQVSASLANRITDRFDMATGVQPPSLCSGLFTTAAVDNIDHNPGSATAVDSFHGTGISLVQHSSSNDKGVKVVLPSCDFGQQSKTIQPLPLSYTSLPPVGSLCKDISVPDVAFTVEETSALTASGLRSESEWLDKVCDVIEKNDNDSALNCSWAAHHASLQPAVTHVCDVNVLLPLFRDPAHSPAMICHAMSIVQSAVQSVNPVQTPVLTMDQPLYSLAKQIQWNWPDRFGESKFVLVLGSLHIEMAVLKTIGDWLEGSGWTTALVNAHVTSAGKAESMLRASHVVRTRHAHQVTAASLHILLQRAYTEYASRCEQVSTLSFADWCEAQCKLHPQFQYWHITLQFELCILLFVRSIRESNFDLYLDTLSQVVLWFFALNHHLYARWLPVHIRDMRTLCSSHPDVLTEFRLGKFTVNKSGRPFSAMGLDQAHEQLNACVKGTGGAVGVTEKPEALLRWMVAGPEVARIVSEFEQASGSRADGDMFYHHEQTKSQQAAFVNHVTSLVNTFEEMGNPFIDEGCELYAIDTHVVCSSAVIETVKTIQSTGQEQYIAFVNERLWERKVPVTAHMSRNKLSLLKQTGSRLKPSQKQTSKLASARNDCSLFSRLYIACQTRDGDLDTFFSHENQPNPPSLSDKGSIRFGTKSDLLSCLENQVTSQLDSPVCDVIVLDGAVVVQMLNPGPCKTFEDYAVLVFVPFIVSQLKKVTRLDLVWDQYFQMSLKATTRSKRGSGVRRRVLPGAELPRNWADFLHNEDNKKELFHFLSPYLISISVDASKQLVVTDGENTLSRNYAVSSALSPCSHEEADTRMILHAADAASVGYTRVLI